jgi:hypothetical protein
MVPAMDRRRSRLTYANVTSTLALAIALGGAGAYAAGKIGANDIKDNAVRSRHIKNGEVTGKDVKESSLKGVDAATLGGTKPERFTLGAGGDSGGTTGVSRKLVTETATRQSIPLVSIAGLGSVQMLCNTVGVQFDAQKDPSGPSVGTQFTYTEHQVDDNTFDDTIHDTLTTAQADRAAPIVVNGSSEQVTVQIFRSTTENGQPAQQVMTAVVSLAASPSNHPNSCLGVAQYWSSTSASS